MQAFRKNHAAERKKEMHIRQISPEIGGYAQESENLCLKQIFTTSEYFDIKYLIQVNETSKNVLTGQQEVFHEE